jgi:hypothetical protein
MKLTLDDIADTRAYEREREAFRTHIMELKSRRRVQVGDIITFLFENRETVRFQVQEMARVEKILTDAGIQGELDTYNTLVPDAGQLSATMFIELTSDAALREWLPRLVGIERCIVLKMAGGLVSRAIVEEQHEQQLTRDDITSTVHYVRFELSPEEVGAFALGDVELAVEHPSLTVSVKLRSETVAELMNDLTQSAEEIHTSP